MKKLMLVCLTSILCTNATMADEYTDLIAYRNQLKEQIEAVDSEIARCEKSIKGWKAATIIGGIGTIASGIGIIAQNQKIEENKKEIQTISADTKEADETIHFIKGVNE